MYGLWRVHGYVRAVSGVVEGCSDGVEETVSVAGDLADADGYAEEGVVGVIITTGET